jgi:hypothetical protein
LFPISPLAISNPPTQLLVVDYYQQEQELFYDGEAAWEELLNNAQPQQEANNDGKAEEGSECRHGRSLMKEIPAISPVSSTAEAFLDYLRPQADHIQLGLV